MSISFLLRFVPPPMCVYVDKLSFQAIEPLHVWFCATCPRARFPLSNLSAFELSCCTTLSQNLVPEITSQILVQILGNQTPLFNKMIFNWTSIRLGFWWQRNHFENVRAKTVAKFGTGKAHELHQFR